MTALYVLGSGSRGNCCAVEYDGTAILIDAGFSPREIERRAETAGLALGSVGAIVLTHEHGDHARGAGRLARRLGVPVLTAPGTWTRLGPRMRHAEHRAARALRPGGGRAVRRHRLPHQPRCGRAAGAGGGDARTAVRRRRRLRPRPADRGRPLPAAQPHRDRAGGEPRRRAAPDQRLSAGGAAPDRGVGRPPLQPRGGRAAGRGAPSRARRSWCWRT